MSIFKKQEMYWASRFEEEDVLVHLPYCKIDFKHPHDTNRQNYMYKPLSVEVSNKIKSISRNNPMAMYTILLSGVQCLLYKYTHETQIIMGMRAMEEKNSDLALSNKVLLLKNNIDHTMSFKSIFNQMKVSFSEAVQHQRISFRKMVEGLSIDYDLNHAPMIHTLVSLGKAQTVSDENNVRSDHVISL